MEEIWGSSLKPLDPSCANGLRHSLVECLLHCFFSSSNLKPLLDTLGLYFQIRDDYANLNSKEVGTQTWLFSSDMLLFIYAVLRCDFIRITLYLCVLRH